MHQRAQTTGSKLTFLGKQPPTGPRPFSILIIFHLGAITSRQHSSLFIFLKRGHRIRGLTRHPTQLVKIGWVEMQEEDKAPPNQPAHLLANISCGKDGEKFVQEVINQQKPRKGKHTGTQDPSTHWKGISTLQWDPLQRITRLILLRFQGLGIQTTVGDNTFPLKDLFCCCCCCCCVCACVCLCVFQGKSFAERFQAQAMWDQVNIAFQRNSRLLLHISDAHPH